ncbi:OpgC domain-containing protein, partial [Acinetobacter baumannii]|uniref:OpgC domain-containing protein n=1 Tax=Acinetobacter baumannii TaxID=470 RepID=UPI002090A05C
MDVLPLYVVLMAAFPPILFFMLSFANAALMLSFTMYVIAVGFGLNLNSYPSGAWYFNPFAWQFL